MLARRHLAAVTAISAVALSACGGSDNNSAGSSSSASTPAPAKTTAPASAGAGATLKLAATESSGLSFDKKQLTAKAGTVTLDMANPSANSSSHAIAIEGNGVDKDGKVV